MELTTIRNATPNPLAIVWKGKQQILGAYAEETMEVEVANRFQELHGNQVAQVTLDTLYGEADRPEPERTVWVANMTGRPDAPEELIVRQPDPKTGELKAVPVPNPFRYPKTLKYRMKGSERTYVDKDGEQASVLEPPKQIQIPPYNVVELSPNFGQWVVRTARASQVAGSADVIKARPLPPWRPDGSWPVNHLRVYLQLCLPQISMESLGPTEEEIGKKHSKDQAAQVLQERKIALLKRIFFCLIDPRIDLPSKQDFEDVAIRNKSSLKTSEDARKIAKNLLEGTMG